MRLVGALTLLILSAPATAHAQEEEKTIPLAEPRLVPVPPDHPTWRAGEPAPPGFHIEHHPNMNLVHVGARLLGGFYLLSGLTAGVATVDNQTGWLFVPLAGPWLTLGLRDRSCNESGLDCVSDDLGEAMLSGWLITLGAGQAAGAVVLTVGLFDQKERLVYSNQALSLVPLRFGRDGQGLALRGTF